MRFLLSIHDVWPGNYPLIADYLRRLRSLGAVKVALLVVPRFHDQKPIEDQANFLEWLREERVTGSEILLHGYRHWMPEQAEGKAFKGHRTTWGRWVNRRLVGQEAEFCGLSLPERIHLLDQGVVAFKKCDLPCLGFVAPTWFGAPPVSALLDHGFQILETRFRIHHFETNRSVFVPPLAWDLSLSNEPKLIGGALWLEALLRLPWIKVAIHPGDFAASSTPFILEKIFKQGLSSAYQDLFTPEKGELI